jgi:hypothetical protein
VSPFLRDFVRWLNGFSMIAVLAVAACQMPVIAQNGPKDDGNLSPLDGKARLHWLAMQTAGPRSLAVGTVSAGWSTLFDSPEEYDTHWNGFGKRYGLRLAGLATSNTIEAGLGAIWGEDPRYHRQTGKPFSRRLWSVIRGTFTSRDSSGRPMPAYAFYVAAPGGQLLSNAWRPDSQATVGNAFLRTAYSILNRMAANAFVEFIPRFGERNR